MNTSPRTDASELPLTPRARVLVIDDNRDIGELYTLFLRQWRYETAYAPDALVGIDTAMFFRPHLILLNVLMPRMTGPAAVPFIRAHPQIQFVKIVFTSGDIRVPDLAVRSRVHGWIIHPASAPTIRTEVERVLALGPD